MTQFEEANRVQFSHLAKIYDSVWLRLYFEPLYRTILKTLSVQAAPLLMSHGRWLDLACGTGEIVARLAQRYPAGQFVGIDFSADMIQRAKQKTAAYNNVDLMISNVTPLPFAQHSFDLVLCSEAFHHFEQPTQVLTEMHRVLRPGGLLLLVDPAAEIILLRLAGRFLRRLEKAQQYYSEPELRRIIESAGFQVTLSFRKMFNNFIIVQS